MLANRTEWPADPVIGKVFPCLEPDSLLQVLRDTLTAEPAERRAAWTTCSPIEALYDPGEHVRIAYVLLKDDSIPSKRAWPQGDVIYVRYPVRKPMSRRGSVVTIDGHEFEVYRFPNDRRLRGLRRFAHRDRAASLWQHWLSEDEPTLALDADSLRRSLLRYVPEQKWIVNLVATCYDGEAQADTKRSVAVRSAGVRECKTIYNRTVAMRRIRKRLDGLFRVPKPVAIDTKLGLLAVRWVWGDPLLDLLRSSDADAVLKLTAGGLHAFHHAPIEDLAHTTTEDYLAGVLQCGKDITAAVPDLGTAVRGVIESLKARVPGPPAVERTVHNDFHHKQLLGRSNRLTILDLERCCLGDPCVDVATFSAQLSFLSSRPDVEVSQAESDAWSLGFLKAWESVTGESLNVARLRWHSAVAMLTLARGMLRHLRPGWPATVHACVERARQFAEARDDVEAVT